MKRLHIRQKEMRDCERKKKDTMVKRKKRRAERTRQRNRTLRKTVPI